MPHLEEYVQAVSSRYYLEFGIGGAFQDPRKSFEVSRIFVVKKGDFAAISSIHDSREPEMLEKLLLNNPHKHPAYAKSRFWKINEVEHARRAMAVVKSLDYSPALYRLKMVGPKEQNWKSTVQLVRESLDDAA
jgi:hypothetical protein